MTSDQQELDLNDTVNKAESTLNPDAKSFCYSKPPIPAVGNDLVADHDTTLTLTNGDASAEEEAGDESSQDSPVSASPPALNWGESVDTGSNLSVAADTGPSPQQVQGAGWAPQPLPEMTQGDPPVTNTRIRTMEDSDQSDQSAAPAKGAEGGSAEAALPSIDPAQKVMENGLDGRDDQEDAEEAARASTPAEGANQFTPLPDLRKHLLYQLEYYFSRDNLEQDHYLQSQMDGDQYVSISTIASFNQIVKLTRNYDLVVDVLKSSNQVQVDSSGTKVRPKYNRSVLMLREIPNDTTQAEVEALFQHESCPTVISCEFAHNGYWYIKFKTDQDAIDAFLYLRQYSVKFKDKSVMARIKANSLVRSVGMSCQYGSGHSGRNNMMTGGQPHQPQQNGVMTFVTAAQQPGPPIQPQYPVMAGALPQYLGQHQVQQTMPQFQLFNFPTVLPQWAAGNTAPHFLDPGAMLAINGYQAAGIKSNNQNRNVFNPGRGNNRGMGKPLRGPSMGSDRLPNARPMDRSPLHNTFPAAYSNPCSNNHSSPDLRTQLMASGSGPSHSEGPAVCWGSGGLLPPPTLVAPAPTPLITGDRSQNCQSLFHGSRTESAVTVPPFPRRGGNYRRQRRVDEGSRNMKSHASPGNKEPHFDLKATSFPPLPGSSNNSNTSGASEGNRLSDVVKGAACSHSTNSDIDKVKSIPIGSATTAYVGTPAETVGTKQSNASADVASLASSLSLNIPVDPLKTGGIESASTTRASSTAEPACDKAATTVESSKLSTKSSSPLGQAAPLAASKPVDETQPAPAKAAAVSSCTTEVKPTAAPAVPAVHSAQPASPGPAPVKLSYAQMVGRKKAESTVRVNKDSQVTSQATPAVPATVPSKQSEQAPAASASVSASAPPRTANASARPYPREQSRRDYDPRERFQAGRRTRDYRDPRDHRDPRQPRFEPRRGDRDVKVSAK